MSRTLTLYLALNLLPNLDLHLALNLHGGANDSTSAGRPAKAELETQRHGGHGVLRAGVEPQIPRITQTGPSLVSVPPVPLCLCAVFVRSLIPCAKNEPLPG